MVNKFTVFDMPIISGIMRVFCNVCLALTGWTMDGELPARKKYIMIAAPHTSNWDFPLMVALVFRFRLKVYWMGKDAMFPLFIGSFFRWFGGIAIDRSKANNLVQQAIDTFDESESMVIIIPPEGTRAKVQRWKSGFYHIAVGAQVPIALGYLDFKEKRGGFLGVFEPTGDYEADLPKIQAFYKDITPKYPDNY